MKRMILTAAILALLLCLPLAAQRTTLPQLPAGPVPVGSPVPPPGYGTASNTTISISAFDFDPVDSATPYTDNGNTYRFFNAAGGRKVWLAPVRVPSGATITGVALNYCDEDAGTGNDYNVAMYDFNSDNTVVLLSFFIAPTLPGCGLAFSPTLAYDFNSNSGHVITLIVFQPQAVIDGTVRFVGAEVSYKLRVSPAPVTATFNDVPTSYPFYQYIEALAAAGITGGCTGPPTPNYCPDAPITRGQMAVFISRALGLHFPN